MSLFYREEKIKESMKLKRLIFKTKISAQKPLNGLAIDLSIFQE